MSAESTKLKNLNPIEAENNLLRALLAWGSDKCVYCSLPKDDMPKCASGFPGCGRADDMMLVDDNPWAERNQK